MCVLFETTPRRILHPRYHQTNAQPRRRRERRRTLSENYQELLELSREPQGTHAIACGQTQA
jgi:hypothetical protein